MSAPVYVCRTPGCPETVGRPGHCLGCTTARNRRRRPEKAVYDSALHQHWRRAVLARDPVCKRCGVSRSVIADHVIPLRRGGSWDYSNGQGLCRRCDGIKGVKERFGYGGASTLHDFPSPPDKRHPDEKSYAAGARP